jgi:hypothetical protein
MRDESLASSIETSLIKLVVRITNCECYMLPKVDGDTSDSCVTMNVLSSHPQNLKLQIGDTAVIRGRPPRSPSKVQCPGALLPRRRQRCRPFVVTRAVSGSGEGEDGGGGGVSREDLERLVGPDDSMFSGLDLANLIRKKYGRSYDVTLIKKVLLISWLCAAIQNFSQLFIQPGDGCAGVHGKEPAGDECDVEV